MSKTNLKSISELGFFRVALGVYFLYYYASFLSGFDTYFGPDSMINLEYLPAFSFSFLIYFWNAIILKMIYGVVMVGFFCFALGMLNHRIFLLLFIAHISFHNINPLVIHEPQPLANLLLLFFFFVPIQTKPTLFCLAKIISKERKKEAYQLIRILIIFFGVYYFLAGLKKLPDSMWREGLALQYLLNWPVLSKGGVLGSWLLSYPLLCKFLTYSILLFEMSFIFLVFTRFRPILIVVGIVFHFFILILMEVGSFSQVMMSWYIILFDTKTCDRFKLFFKTMFKSV